MIPMNSPGMLNAIGSKLINRMNGMADNKDLDNRFIRLPAVPTGFNVYDAFSGSLAMGMNGYPILNGGLYPRLCNIIGESATGKTSLMIKTRASAVDRVWRKFGQGYSEMYFIDAENNTPDFRFLNVSGWSPADFMTKCNYSQGQMSLLELANLIIKIYDIKNKYRKDFILPSGIRDIDGREVLFLAPTFICLDSVVSINPNGVESLLEHDKAGEMKDLEKLSSNMEAMLDAKAWTIFVRKIKPYLDGGNISLDCVNHKTKEPKIDMYAKETRYLPFLSMGEKIKGGKEFIYQSYNILDLASGEKFDAKNPVYGDAIDGFAAWAMFVKNKQNIEGVKFPMVFDKATGYNAELSDMEYLWQSKFGLQGTVKLAFDVLPEVTFTRKTLLDQIQEFPELGRALAFTARYAASHQMLYYKPAPSLAGFANVPLDQRLSMLYHCTESYHPSHDVDLPHENLFRIAQENRHYVHFDNMALDTGNIVLKKEDITRAEEGFSMLTTVAVTPFDGICSPDGKYIYPSDPLNPAPTTSDSKKKAS